MEPEALPANKRLKRLCCFSTDSLANNTLQNRCSHHQTSKHSMHQSKHFRLEKWIWVKSLAEYNQHKCSKLQARGKWVKTLRKSHFNQKNKGSFILIKEQVNINVNKKVSPILFCLSSLMIRFSGVKVQRGRSKLLIRKLFGSLSMRMNSVQLELSGITLLLCSLKSYIYFTLNKQHPGS